LASVGDMVAQRGGGFLFYQRVSVPGFGFSAGIIIVAKAFATWRVGPFTLNVTTVS
jgi:hypothetical protein